MITCAHQDTLSIMMHCFTLNNALCCAYVMDNRLDGLPGPRGRKRRLPTIY